MSIRNRRRLNHYSIRKLTIGACSVLIGATLFLGAQNAVVHADTVPNSSAPASAEVKSSKPDEAPDAAKADETDTSAKSAAPASADPKEQNEPGAKQTPNNQNISVQSSKQNIDAPKVDFNRQYGNTPSRDFDNVPTYKQAGLSETQNMTQNSLNRINPNKSVGNPWSNTGIANIPENKDLHYDLSISAQNQKTGKTYQAGMAEDMGHTNHVYVDPVNSKNITLHAHFTNNSKQNIQFGSVDKGQMGWDAQIVMDMDNNYQHTLQFSKTNAPKLTIINSDGTLDKNNNFEWWYAYGQSGDYEKLPNGQPDITKNTCITFHGLLKIGQTLNLDIPLDYDLKGNNINKSCNDFTFRSGSAGARPLRVYTILPNVKYETLTRTIIDNIPNETPKVTVQKVSYENKITIDPQTGHASYNGWFLTNGSPAIFPEYIPVGAKSYTASPNSVKEIKPDINSWKNSTIYINYSKISSGNKTGGNSTNKPQPTNAEPNVPQTPVGPETRSQSPTITPVTPAPVHPEATPTPVSPTSASEPAASTPAPQLATANNVETVQPHAEQVSAPVKKAAKKQIKTVAPKSEAVKKNASVAKNVAPESESVKNKSPRKATVLSELRNVKAKADKPEIKQIAFKNTPVKKLVAKQKASLPQTGEAQNKSGFMSAVGLALASLASLFALGSDRKQRR